MNDPAGVTILYEDNHLLVVNKPAGLPSQPDESGAASLVDWARESIRLRHEKPGNVYVGLVHRLDQPVSGVVVLARTSKAAARLSEQFRKGTVVKTYWAIVEGFLEPDAGVWRDRLTKDRARNFVRVVDQTADEDDEDSREAELTYRVLGRGSNTCLLELVPRTGRGHQLRVQLASRGLPIIGDLKYGAKSRLIALDGGHRIALHARSVRFKHPTKEEVIECSAEVPADWPARTTWRARTTNPSKTPKGRPEPSG